MSSLGEALSDYLVHCQFERNLSSLTLKAYNLDLRQFISFAGSTTALDQVTKELIRSYMKRMFEQKLRETSIRRKLASLKAFFRYLEAEDKIPVSPFRKLNVRLRIPKTVPRSMSLENVRQLFATVDQEMVEGQNHHPTSKGSSAPITRTQFNSIEKKTILELLFATGMRVGEMCHMKVEDVDLSNKAIRVLGKGSRERTIILTHEGVIGSLERYLSFRASIHSNTDSLFINRFKRPMQTHSIRCILRRSALNANLPLKITPHMFRHTTATLMLENGIDIRVVQRFLGHSSILTTQWYTHISSSAEREIITARHPRNYL
jgi:integrase/recombinase XerD